MIPIITLVPLLIATVDLALGFPPPWDTSDIPKMLTAVGDTLVNGDGKNANNVKQAFVTLYSSWPKIMLEYDEIVQFCKHILPKEIATRENKATINLISQGCRIFEARSSRDDQAVITKFLLYTHQYILSSSSRTHQEISRTYASNFDVHALFDPTKIPREFVWVLSIWPDMVEYCRHTVYSFDYSAVHDITAMVEMSKLGIACEGLKIPK